MYYLLNKTTTTRHTPNAGYYSNHDFSCGILIFKMLWLNWATVVSKVKNNSNIICFYFNLTRDMAQIEYYD